MCIMKQLKKSGFIWELYQTNKNTFQFACWQKKIRITIIVFILEKLLCKLSGEKKKHR